MFSRSPLLAALLVGSFAMASCTTSGDRIAPSDRLRSLMSQSPEDGVRAKFADAIFALIAGQTPDRAKATLIAEGADCVNTVCSWTTIQRESWFEAQGTFRAPGPARIYRWDWRVEFLAPTVAIKDDVKSTVSVERIR